LWSLTIAETGQRAAEKKINSEEMTIFYILPVVFLSCAVFGLAVYVAFTRLILSKGLDVDSIVLLFLPGLVHIDGPAGIIVGFISVAIFCVL
jgi:flagellar biosynthesis component FlhA